MDNFCKCEVCGYHHALEECPEVEQAWHTLLLGSGLGAAAALILYGLEALALV